MNHQIIQKSLNKANKSIQLVCLYVLIPILTCIHFSCADTGRSILSVTDIHFNPFHDSLITQQLTQTDYKNWDKVFTSIKDTVIAVYNEETSPLLLKHLLQSMKENSEGIGAVIFTGDLLAHHFNEMFYKYTGNTNEEAKNNFVYNTVGYISLKFRQTFPGKPIYFSLGNNDSYMGDYAIVDDGSFLKNTADLFYSNFINTKTTADTNGKDEFFKTYSKHGYYNQKFSLVENGRIIGLNTIFFSSNYMDSGMNPTPGEKHLQWLEEQLLAAEKASEKVWLLLHIPPGVNVYSTEHNSTEPDINVKLQWKDVHNEKFLQLMQRFYIVIVASFAGHTHMDDFRLIYSADTTFNKPFEYIHITPSVSPVFGNNPAYQIIDLNTKTGSLTETTTYYLDIDSLAAGFNLEYHFWPTYYVTPDLKGLHPLYKKLPKHP
ncbi:MAG: hypothetical protein MI922_20990, partial [Bacteroidales bacterium]|nr:hypothetical protein [Bacteroidales bacterium]